VGISGKSPQRSTAACALLVAAALLTAACSPGQKTSPDTSGASTPRPLAANDSNLAVAASPTALLTPPPVFPSVKPLPDGWMGSGTDTDTDQWDLGLPPGFSQQEAVSQTDKETWGAVDLRRSADATGDPCAPYFFTNRPPWGRTTLGRSADEMVQWATTSWTTDPWPGQKLVRVDPLTTPAGYGAIVEIIKPAANGYPYSHEFDFYIDTAQGIFVLQAGTCGEASFAKLRSVFIQIPDYFTVPALKSPSDNPVALTSSEPTGAMKGARLRPVAIRLDDGRVLVAGGADNGARALGSAEMYDPKTGKFQPTGSMKVARDHASAVLLRDGRVLVVGGNSSEASADSALASAEVYDPKTGKFTVAAMHSPRIEATATLLPDGRALVAGGSDGKQALTSAEVYDPTTNEFTSTGSMATARYFHTATPLPGGKVLVAGGRTASGITATAELYDPATGTFATTGPLSGPRVQATATALSDGRVLVAGGGDGNSVNDTADVYNPASGAFTPVGKMTTSRSGAFSAVLSDGRVMVGGGATASNGYLASVDVFDPETGTFAFGGYIWAPRLQASAVALTGGRVLVVGGTDSSAALPTAELVGLISKSS